MAKPPTKSTDAVEADALVVLGLDEQEKPRAARFTTGNAALVAKAADAMALRVVKITAGDHADLVKKLPLGRLYSNGKGFVPFVRREIYLKLTTTLGLTVAAEKAAPAPLPRTWVEISAGSLVIAPDTTNGGWYEAIVTERNGDMISYRWRDFPKQPKGTCHVASVALLNADTAQ